MKMDATGDDISEIEPGVESNEHLKKELEQFTKA